MPGIRKRTAYRRRTRRRYVRKRTPVKKRAVRRAYRRAPRSVMSRRKVQDITSRKKKDTFGPAGGGTAFLPPVGRGPAGVTGGAGLNRGYSMFAWMPFARTPQSAQQFNVLNETMRTATQCYIRGLKEKIRIQTNSPHTWEWRRVVFTYQGSALVTPEDLPTFGIAQLSRYDTTPTTDGGAYGYIRLLPNLSDTTSSGATANAQIHDNFMRQMFRGTEGVDYDNPFQAKVDPDKITIYHDSKRVFRSGNDRGSMWDLSKWHGFNKYLYYNDFEEGDEMRFSNFSAEMKKSLGDVYVIDFIAPAFGSTEDDSLLFNTHATVYWHEK